MAFKGAYINSVKIGPIGADGNPQQTLEANTTGVLVVFATTEDGPNTITVTGAAPFLGLVAGQTFYVTGATNSGNNGSKTVVSVDTPGNIATVSETLTNEASSSPSPVSITTYPV